jgi:hypothetical protein
MSKRIWAGLTVEDQGAASAPSPVREVRGMITLANGTTSEFMITQDGWTQWGAVTSRLGETVDVLTVLSETLVDEGLLERDLEEDEDAEREAEASVMGVVYD